MLCKEVVEGIGHLYDWLSCSAEPTLRTSPRAIRCYCILAADIEEEECFDWLALRCRGTLGISTRLGSYQRSGSIDT